jgi:hypothetical protein
VIIHVRLTAVIIVAGFWVANNWMDWWSAESTLNSPLTFSIYSVWYRNNFQRCA